MGEGEDGEQQQYTVHITNVSRLYNRSMQSNASRRSFLASSVLVPASAMLASAANAIDVSNPYGEFKLGVASYSLRKFTRAKAIQMTRELGVRYINIKAFHLALDSKPEEIKAARAEFESAGLTILGGGNIPFDKDDDADIRGKFEYAKLAGMPLMVCSPAVKVLPKLEKYVREYDIKLAVHNHGPKDKFPAPQDALKLLKDMDPRCGVCVDVGHTAEAGVDVLAAIRASGVRMFDMHIKDVRVMLDERSQCDVGDGLMPIVAIFRQLHSMNYSGGVMLEYEINEEDPLPGMQRSFAYMRGVLAGLKG